MKSIIKNTGRPSDQVESIDLDVTPVMNMFIILIPFLVSMAVFAHLSILPFSLPPSAGDGSGPKTDDLKITVSVRQTGYLLTLGETLLDSLDMVDGTYDHTGLVRILKRQRPDLKHPDEAVIAVDDGIIFDHVVQAMDDCRDAGFLRIGLAGGSENGNVP